MQKETMIFPRYHQMDAVRLLVDEARREGVGNNYLVEHSAGSGKSNTIGWLAHRLASLHNGQNERIFDSVIVITDRVVETNQEVVRPSALQGAVHLPVVLQDKDWAHQSRRRAAPRTPMSRRSRICSSL